LGGSPSLQAKSADELVQLKRKGNEKFAEQFDRHRHASVPVNDALCIMNASEQKITTQNFLVRRSGAETLASSRGLTFGGAGASLAIILLIAQIGVTKTAVAWSLGFAATAFPLWLSLALTYDLWLALKLDVHDLFALKWLHQLQAWWFYLTGVLTFLSIASLVHSLDASISTIFIGSCLVGFAFVVATLCAAVYRIRHHMLRTGGENAQGNDA
jgi:hypothetical protein